MLIDLNVKLDDHEKKKLADQHQSEMTAAIASSITENNNAARLERMYDHKSYSCVVM